MFWRRRAFRGLVSVLRITFGGRSEHGVSLHQALGSSNHPVQVILRGSIRLADNQRRIGAAKTKGIGHGVADRTFFRLVRHQIKPGDFIGRVIKV